MSDSFRKLCDEAAKALGWEPQKTSAHTYQVPEAAGEVVSMTVTDDARYLLVDCAKAVVKFDLDTDKVELLMLEESQ